MSDYEVFCGQCGERLPELLGPAAGPDAPAHPPCSNCGSTAVTFKVGLSAQVILVPAIEATAQVFAPTIVVGPRTTVDEVIREIAPHLHLRCEIYFREPEDPDSKYMIRVEETSTSECLYGPELFETAAEAAEALYHFFRDQLE